MAEIDHPGAMLTQLLRCTLSLPDGFTIDYRERHDAVIDHTHRDVVITPPGVNVDTFKFGAMGAYAHISVDPSGDSYMVGVYATDVSYNVQSAGRVVAFPDPERAVVCAVDEIQGCLRRQERGW